MPKSAATPKVIKTIIKKAKDKAKELTALHKRKTATLEATLEKSKHQLKKFASELKDSGKTIRDLIRDIAPVVTERADRKLKEEEVTIAPPTRGAGRG